MTIQIAILAAIITIEASPVLAESGAALQQLRADYGDTSEPYGQTPAAPQPSIFNPQPAPQPGVPGSCTRPIVTINNFNEISSNGEKLGSNVSSYMTSCTGDVAWLDKYGHIYKNATEIGERCVEFRMAEATGDIFWLDNLDYLFKNTDKLGEQVERFEVADTGDMAWIDIFNEIYKNGRKIGEHAKEFSLLERTGDLVWLDIFGKLRKNDKKIAELVDRFLTAERSGDIAWVTSSGDLYKNNLKIAYGWELKSFEMDKYGRILWTDKDGQVHIA